MNHWRVQVLVGGLVLGVMGLIAVFAWPQLKTSSLAGAAVRNAAPPTPGNPGTAATAPPAAPAETNQSAPEALRPIDRQAILERWPDWLAGHTRDPFQMLAPAADATNRLAPLTPARHLKLAATWLQTGARLAVIDQRVYGPGDTVAGYTILQIEPGRVELQGPNSTETITFTSYTPPPPPGQRSLISTNLIEKLLGPETEKLRN